MSTQTPRTERHFLTVQPCDHTAPFCDGEEECPGWGDDCTIECESDEDANCRWMCPTCADDEGQWSYNGNGICGQDHQMTRCPCLVVSWRGGQSTELVIEEPRVGRHAVVDEWDDGYTLTYVDEAVS